MKKTLLLTTALIGTLSVLGTAQAELKIGAHVKTAWKSAESLTATGKASSGFSQERQIDLSTSGTLNNGWKYAAGFSLEQDGGQTGFDGGEGNFVNVSPQAGTVIELGNDHIALHSDFNIVPRAGNAMNEEIDTYGGLKYAQNYGVLKESMGLGIVQDVPSGKVMFNYIPQRGKKAETADTVVSSDAEKRAYEMSYFGKPIDNLDLYLNYRNATKNNLDTDNQTNKKAGFAYTAGSFKIGYEQSRNVDASNGDKVKMQEIGAVVKLSDNATAGIGRTKTSDETKAGVAIGSDETINYLQIGYSLGAIGTQFSYISTSNLGTTASQDPNAFVFKVNTKF